MEERQDYEARSYPQLLLSTGWRGRVEAPVDLSEKWEVDIIQLGDGYWMSLCHH